MVKKPADNRIKSGIPGFDALVRGGIPQGTLNLLAGHASTGRSIFAMQFLCHGAKERNETGIYITLEKEPAEVLENMEGFSWGLNEMVKQKKIFILKADIYRFDKLKHLIHNEVDRRNAKRLVIDPFSLVAAYFGNVYDVRKTLSDLRREVKRLDCTTIAISDIKEGEQTFSSMGFAEFVVGGVIVLGLQAKKENGRFVRTVFVRKMEKTNHSIDVMPISIDENGIRLHTPEKVF